MIDLIELRIPFLATSLAENLLYDGRLTLNLKELSSADNITLSSGSVNFDGPKYIIDELRHPYESLKSSFSGLAFKIFPIGCGTYDMPYVLLKGSPAKIMQGHNVYGSCKFAPAFREFLSILASIYPNTYSKLNIRGAEIRALDCTFFARAESEFISKQVIKMLSRVSNRHIRSSREGYETTTYLNRKSTYYQLKTYLKTFEVNKEINELNQTIKKTFNLETKANLLKKLSILIDAEKFSKNMIRFEGRIMARKMTDLGIPVNALKFCDYIKDNDETIIKNLWSVMFNPILETLEGQELDTFDDQTVINNIKLTFDKTRKQNQLINFFLILKSQGYQRTKDSMPRATFWRNEKELLEIGLSKINLQNIENETSNVVPIIKVINIDFEAQLPSNFQEPISQFETRLRAV
jgi:II/X family phage/plasmid replication protein